ncbi:hypothetical protein G9H71_14230 [Motilibacter sp. E257]|uniref:WD40 repeat protein n=1 Tax=Motilibacter deserti TaxID=2714956 RepID=A0ABX0GZG7_9ACTN|nr:hypothetical protein [Motilibacter deserti]
MRSARLDRGRRGPALGAALAAGIAAAVVAGLLPAAATARAAAEPPADGYIAYEADGSLWAMPFRDDAQPTELLANVGGGTSVALSADGSTLAVAGPDGVHVATARTGSARTVLHVGVAAAALSPDGSRLYYARNAPPEPEPDYDDGSTAVPLPGRPAPPVPIPVLPPAPEEDEPETDELWSLDLATGNASRLPVQTGPVHDIEVSADAATLGLVVGGQGRWADSTRAALLTLDTGRTELVGGFDARDVTFDVNGGLVVSSGNPDAVQTVDGFDLFPLVTDLSLAQGTPEGIYATGGGEPEPEGSSAPEPGVRPSGPLQLWLKPTGGGEPVRALEELPHTASGFGLAFAIGHGPLPAPWTLRARVERVTLDVYGRLVLGQRALTSVGVDLATPGSSDGQVQVQERRPAGWTTVADVPLERGYATVELPLRETTVLRAVVAGVASKPRRVRVASAVFLSATRAGSDVRLRGSVRGPDGGRVLVQRRVGTRWTQVGTAAVRRGRFATSARFDAAGTWRVVRPATRTLDAGTSSAVRVSAVS